VEQALSLFLSCARAGASGYSSLPNQHISGCYTLPAQRLPVNWSPEPKSESPLSAMTNSVMPIRISGPVLFRAILFASIMLAIGWAGCSQHPSPWLLRHQFVPNISCTVLIPGGIIPIAIAACTVGVHNEIPHQMALILMLTWVFYFALGMFWAARRNRRRVAQVKL
jgi:hypothetical protein